MPSSSNSTKRSKQPISKIIGDSGASGTYFNIKDINHLTNVSKHLSTSDSIKVSLPDGRSILSSHIGFLKIDQLSLNARKVFLFPDIKGSLLSFGPLCDDNCKVILDKDSAKVLKHGRVILTGNRSATTGLWYMNLPSSLSKEVQQNVAAAIKTRSVTKCELEKCKKNARPFYRCSQCRVSANSTFNRCRRAEIIRIYFRKFKTSFR